MNFLNGITILLLYQLAGEISTLLLRLPIPGPVLGMMFLFLTLIGQRRIPKSLELVSENLLSHLSLLFIPAGVGVMLHFDLIVQESTAISLTLFLSTIITMAVTAIMMLMTQHILDQRERKNV